MTAMKDPRLIHLTGDPHQGVFCLQLFRPGQKFPDEAPPEFLDQPLPSSNWASRAGLMKPSRRARFLRPWMISRKRTSWGH